MISQNVADGTVGWCTSVPYSSNLESMLIFGILVKDLTVMYVVSYTSVSEYCIMSLSANHQQSYCRILGMGNILVLSYIVILRAHDNHITVVLQL